MEVISFKGDLAALGVRYFTIARNKMYRVFTRFYYFFNNLLLGKLISHDTCLFTFTGVVLGALVARA